VRRRQAEDGQGRIDQCEEGRIEIVAGGAGIAFGHVVRLAVEGATVTIKDEAAGRIEGTEVGREGVVPGITHLVDAAEGHEGGADNEIEDEQAGQNAGPRQECADPLHTGHSEAGQP